MSEKRYLIEGTLTTKTSLQIGSGEVATHNDIKDGDTSVLIDAVALTADERPCLPGSSLKGALRAYLKRLGSSHLDALFGSADRAGKVEVHYAYCASTDVPQGHTSPPHWQREKLTGVDVAVALDRHTRTAEEDKLFHRQIVPPGIAFNLTITADRLTENELADLLHAVEGFNDGAITLGGDKASDQGRLEWRLTKLCCLGKVEVEGWLKALENGPSVDWRAFTADVTHNAVAQPNLRPRLRLELVFDHRFLVDDPSRKGAKGEPDFFPRLDEQGRSYLPAKSFRGAFRAQAERILRTQGLSACTGKDSCRDPKKLCKACEVFGAPGWRSLLECTDFVSEQALVETHQQFVAVDRFTGGARDGALYQISAAESPLLAGNIAVDAERMPLWGYGLLALTLRDLVEGDIRFGYGRAKGYGTVRGRIGGDAGAWKALCLSLWSSAKEPLPACDGSLDSIKKLLSQAVEQLWSLAKETAFATQATESQEEAKS